MSLDVNELFAGARESVDTTMTTNRKRIAPYIRKTTSTLVMATLLVWAASVAGADPMRGQWRGNWVSQETGHRGRLNAHFRPVGANQYRATFTGTFAKVIPFRYGMRMNVKGQSGDTIYFGGSRSLGVFGRFTYEACATPTYFNAQYSSRRDRGQFEMRKR